MKKHKSPTAVKHRLTAKMTETLFWVRAHTDYMDGRVHAIKLDRSRAQSASALVQRGLLDWANHIGWSGKRGYYLTDLGLSVCRAIENEVSSYS